MMGRAVVGMRVPNHLDVREGGRAEGGGKRRARQEAGLSGLVGVWAPRRPGSRQSGATRDTLHRPLTPMRLGGGGVEREGEREFAADDEREVPHPHRDQGYDHEEGGGDGADRIAPHARHVHEAVEQRQAPLQQGRARGVERDLEVALGPAGPLLEAVADLQHVCIGGVGRGVEVWSGAGATARASAPSEPRAPPTPHAPGRGPRRWPDTPGRT